MGLWLKNSPNEGWEAPQPPAGGSARMFWADDRSAVIVGYVDGLEPDASTLAAEFDRELVDDSSAHAERAAWLDEELFLLRDERRAWAHRTRGKDLGIAGVVPGPEPERRSINFPGADPDSVLTVIAGAEWSDTRIRDVLQSTRPNRRQREQLAG